MVVHNARAMMTCIDLHKTKVHYLIYNRIAQGNMDSSNTTITTGSIIIALSENHSKGKVINQITAVTIRSSR